MNRMKSVEVRRSKVIVRDDDNARIMPFAGGAR